MWVFESAGQVFSEITMEQEIVEQILDNLDQEVDLSEFTELLRFYLKHKIDLNTTDGKELRDLLFLSPLQVLGIIKHRHSTGAFLSVVELQAVEELDLQTAEMLLPFVTVRPRGNFRDLTWKELRGKTDQEAILRYGRVLEEQLGYTIEDANRSRYLGDPNRYMVRYRLNMADKVMLAVNMKKDAGEPFFREQQQFGFDHYGASLYVKGETTLKELIIGDYALQVGQGLVAWNGLSFGKGAMITTSARHAATIRPYTSMNEFNFLRGVAATLRWRDVEITPFASLRHLSGSVVETEGGTEIRSISLTGLHRTPTELRNRHQVRQLVTGANVYYNRRRLRLGAVALYSRYNGTIVPAAGLRNLYSFRGQQSTNVAVNYQFTLRNAYFFGEYAYQIDGDWATINGIIASLHPKVSVFANYRNYQKGYYAPLSQALGEGSRVTNERGVYSGISYRLARKVDWVSYVDIFRFPWLRYRVDAPSAGFDIFSQFTYSWYKKGNIALRYRYRVKQENSPDPRPERLLADIWRHQVRLNFQYKLSRHWEIRSRCETVSFQKEYRFDRGTLFFQDVFWTPQKLPFHLNMRMAMFHTDSYDARLYAFENDVLYASSFPLYNGKGWRSYANLRYRMTKQVDFWARYSVSSYRNVETVGSGLDRSDGAVRSEVKIQMRYRW
ncbi:helix-hairpin-helix domain-containing protein [Sphingobacterium paludis]|uniref:Helix-hairpin-helix protein n=1 Tax=Sphingobacterium paludis TaxID=1476465 RepID=A0A4V3E260_9SPHI|nr:helix-hairpin-helix domain-containing protein [Sphingobacterium paludis]TDS16008.1 helix-hairpin-helix protein [Sphingobacterium paludis]